MPSTYGTCSVCHSVNVPVWNTLCGSCAVILSNALHMAQRAPHERFNAAEGYALWEVVEAADEVADLLTGKGV